VPLDPETALPLNPETTLQPNPETALLLNPETALLLNPQFASEHTPAYLYDPDDPNFGFDDQTCLGGGDWGDFADDSGS
jgi:hypothetical protein